MKSSEHGNLFFDRHCYNNSWTAQYFRLKVLLWPTSTWIYTLCRFQPNRLSWSNYRFLRKRNPYHFYIWLEKAWRTVREYMGFKFFGMNFSFFEMTHFSAIFHLKIDIKVSFFILNLKTTVWKFETNEKIENSSIFKNLTHFSKKVGHLEKLILKKLKPIYSRSRSI